MKIKEIISEDDVQEFIECLGEKYCFFDTETTGLYPYHGDRPFLLQFIFGESDSCFLLQTAPVVDNKLINQDTIYTILNTFAQAFIDNSGKTICAHNAKFDMHQLHNLLQDYGIEIEEWMCTIWDTMPIAKVLKNNEFSVSLSSCAEQAQLNYQKSSIVEDYLKEHKKDCYAVDVFGNKSPRYDFIPSSIMFEYAAQDVFTLRDLFSYQQKRIHQMLTEQEFPRALLDVIKTELECTKSIFYMERRGAMVDLSHLTSTKTEGQLEEDSLAFKYFLETGRNFVDSSKELADVFQTCYGIELPKGSPTKTGQINFLSGEATLINLKHPLADLILELRGIKKLNSTFVLPMFRYKDQHDRIHANYFQCGADTLRMSCQNPNLQNLPREATGWKDVRGAFVPPSGKFIISTDFDAMEAKVAVALANEKRLIDLINSGKDFHAENAAIARCSRTAAKNLFFGILYGSGAGVVANQLNISVQEASALRNRIKSVLPETTKFSYRLQNFVAQDGFILTQFGNPLHIDENFAYKALNYAVQGLCAQIAKRALNAWTRLSFKRQDGYPIIFVHDEILAEFSHVDADVEREFTQCFRESFPETNGITMSASFSSPMKRWKK